MFGKMPDQISNSSYMHMHIHTAVSGFVMGAFSKTLCPILPDKRRYMNRTEFINIPLILDHLYGLVVRVRGYRYRGPGSDSWHYQIF
jgi:hypothetical protein